MKKNKLILFIISIIMLFAIPLYTTYKNYDLLLNGQEYLFKIETFDPYDIFRGKYLYVNFANDEISTYKENIDNENNDECYVEIKKDNEGFAYFTNVTFEKPKDIKNYYKTSGYYYNYSKTYKIDTPNRYYMNEKKIVDAEKFYNENIEDAYVKVRVKNGNMIITGIYVNDEPLESYSYGKENK